MGHECLCLLRRHECIVVSVGNCHVMQQSVALFIICIINTATNLRRMWAFWKCLFSMSMWEACWLGLIFPCLRKTLHISTSVTFQRETSPPSHEQTTVTDSQMSLHSHLSRLIAAARCLRNAALTDFLPEVFFMVHFLMLHDVKHTHTHLSHTSKCLNVTALDHKISKQENTSTPFKQTIWQGRWKHHFSVWVIFHI